MVLNQGTGCVRSEGSDSTGGCVQCSGSGSGYRHGQQWRRSERPAAVAGAVSSSVGGSGCEQARWKRKRQGSANGESGSDGEAGLG